VRSDGERLDDMLEALDDIEAFTRSLTKKRFIRAPEQDRQLFRATAACLAVIGEASKALSPALKARHPAIEWGGLAGLRDVIAHQYYRLDLEQVWGTIRDDLPALRGAVEEELSRI
jgi:uncharacterized protein with HEPN domain